MKKRIFPLFFVLSLAFSLFFVAQAKSPDILTTSPAEAAQTLYDFGLFQGVSATGEEPDFALDRTPTRAEAITMLVRLLGKEEEALSGDWTTPFTDVADWAAPYVGYAYENGLTTGTSATTFGSANSISESEFLTLVLRALGYESGVDFEWNDARSLAEPLRLVNQRKKSVVSNFTRGSVAQICLQALSTRFKGRSVLLYESLGLTPTETMEMWGESAFSGYAHSYVDPDYPNQTTTRSYPSNGPWEGVRGRTVAAWVESCADVEAVLARYMPDYPARIVLYSSSKLMSYDDNIPGILYYSNYESIFDPYLASGVESTKAWPCSARTPSSISTDYNEICLDINYTAGGYIHMLKEGILDALPTEVSLGSGFPDDCDFTTLLDVVETIERDYDLTENSSDFDKAYAAYHYLTQTTSYDSELAQARGSATTNLYEGLVYPAEVNYLLTKHKGVCFNYALTYQALCQSLGLNCYYVDNLVHTGKVGHAWNILELDGQFYQVDATWDVERPPEFFHHFLLSDETMDSRHDFRISSEYNVPACPEDYPLPEWVGHGYGYRQ